MVVGDEVVVGLKLSVLGVLVCSSQQPNNRPSTFPAKLSADHSVWQHMLTYEFWHRQNVMSPRR